MIFIKDEALYQKQVILCAAHYGKPEFMNDDQLRLPEEEQGYYRNYFLKIESLFAALRGRSLLLSPADYQLAREWYDKGIPLSCVLRGLREAFFKKLSEADQEEEIHSLGWCRWAVMKEWKQYKSVPVSPEKVESSPPDKSGDEVPAILDSACFDLKKSCETSRAEGRTELADALSDVLAGIVEAQAQWQTDGNLEVMEANLQHLDEQMISAALEHLETETLKKIEKSVDRKLKPHAAAMTAQQLQQTRESALRSKVRILLQLPVLTLYTF